VNNSYSSYLFSVLIQAQLELCIHAGYHHIVIIHQRQVVI